MIDVLPGDIWVDEDGDFVFVIDIENRDIIGEYWAGNSFRYWRFMSWSPDQLYRRVYRQEDHNWISTHGRSPRVGEIWEVIGENCNDRCIIAEFPPVSNTFSTKDYARVKFDNDSLGISKYSELRFVSEAPGAVNSRYTPMNDWEVDLLNATEKPTGYITKEVTNGFVTLDSGEREVRPSGYTRDTENGKARFDLLLPLDVPYGEQFLTRVADLLGRGASKYSARNWELADDAASLERYKSSAYRHLVQFLAGEVDEDHAAAVVFNLLGHETLKYKLAQDKGQSE